MYLPYIHQEQEVPWLDAIAIGLAAGIIWRIARDATKAFLDGLRGKR